MTFAEEMMHYTIRAFVPMLLACLSISCRQSTHQHKADAITPGMSKSQVVQQIGRPAVESVLLHFPTGLTTASQSPSNAVFVWQHTPQGQWPTQAMDLWRYDDPPGFTYVYFLRDSDEVDRAEFRHK